ncbi:MAG: cupin domain-containing protein [Microthrixaceae bacterium]|nr:cupin domain-containing protein [Microthrixaceae bacterium]
MSTRQDVPTGTTETDLSARAPGYLAGGVVRLVDPSEMKGRTLRLPDPDDPLEAPLAAANERSIDVADEYLSKLFPDLPLGRFAQATDATTLVVGRSAPELLDSIGPERLVEEMFQRLNFEPPGQIRFMRDKQARDLGDIATTHPHPYPGGHVRLRPAALAAALDEGYTMVLDGVELRNGPSMLLAEMFERLFGCAVNINGYLSTRSHTSFGAHWDDQEVVIVQLLGRKDWVVEAPPALSPLKSSHGDATSGRTVWEGRLHPGDVMYIPRGWGHLVRGIDELSYHYTITIPRINGMRILNGVLSEAATTGRVMRPGVGTAMQPATRVSLAHLDVLDADQLSSAVRSALAVVRLGMPTRLVQPANASLAFAGRATMVRSACPGGWVVAGTAGDEALIGMANTMLAVPRTLVPQIAALFDGGNHQTSDVAPDMVAGLVDAGLLGLMM